MELLLQFFDNKIVLTCFSLTLGAIIGIIVKSWWNKTSIFSYRITVNQVGLSTEHAVFGTVRATWQDNPVRNLHFVTIEVENRSTRDFEDVEFVVFSEQETWLLNEMTERVDSPYIVEYSSAFKEKMKVPEGEKLTEDQMKEWLHRRDYALPVLNRGRRIRFSYLCTKPNDDGAPDVWIDTPSKGIKLRKARDPYVILNPMWGVPVPSAQYTGLLVAVLVFLACGLFINDVWLASFIAMFVGLFAQLFGALLYKLWRAIRGAVSG